MPAVGILLSLLGGLGAAAGAAGAADNLAAHQSYECVTPPNYWGWKGPVHGDKGQLTDGKVLESWTDAEGREFYSLPGVDGWTSIDPVVLVFDLGEVRPIQGVGLHSVLSPWGPWWPEEIAVLVSDEGTDFYKVGPPLKVSAGQLTPPLSPEVVQAAIDRAFPERGLAPTTHWWRTDPLQARGRYVSLIMTPPPSTGTIVLDEVEIYEGPPDSPRAPRPAQVFREGPGGWQSYLLWCAVDERLSRDIRGLAEKIAQSSLPEAARRELQARLQRLEQQRSDMPVPPGEGFRAVLPVNDLHRDIFRVQARLWRAEGAPDLRVWHSHRWDPLAPLDEPRPGKPRVRIVMAANEVRSDVLNLTNASQKDAAVRLTFRGLPGDNLTVFEVLTVDTKAMEPVTAAMVPAEKQKGAYRIHVPAGLTRQVWLRCSSKGLTARSYTGTVHLTADQGRGFIAEVPASIEVWPVRLPDRFTLSVGGWDYAIDESYEVTARNRDQVVAVLREYGINVPWASGSVMPHGTYDAEGSLVTPPARDLMDRWLALWPDARCYCVFNDSAGLPLGDPQRAKKIAAWARDWADHLRARGVAPHQMALLLRDEPTTEGELQTILENGRAIKQGTPEWKVWNDLHFADPHQAPPAMDAVMREACDIQCFNRQHYQQEPEANDAFMAKYRHPGREWWTYTAGANNRLADPYVDWLLQEWFCFDKGLSGSHFWAFGDSGGGFSWNEYLNPRIACTPLYLAADAATTAKTMEALREGLQDYELLLLLRKELARPSGLTEAQRTQAQQVLEEGVRAVLVVDDKDHWAWSTPKDRSTADRVRERILGLLQEGGVSGP